MSTLLNFLSFMSVSVLVIVVFQLGLLHAFFPINDQETSTFHRVVVMTLTTGLCILIINLMRV